MISTTFASFAAVSSKALSSAANVVSTFVNIASRNLSSSIEFVRNNPIASRF